MLDLARCVESKRERDVEPGHGVEATIEWKMTDRGSLDGRVNALVDKSGLTRAGVGEPPMNRRASCSSYSLSIMGMHTGVLAAAAEWPRLREKLEGVCGRFDDDVLVNGDEWFTLPDRVDGLNVATSAGLTYLMDPTMVWTVNQDFVVELSRSLDCVVVSGGAETVSGTFWLTASESGKVRRLHWNVISALTQPFDIGDPLESEATVPLEDPDGKGIYAAVAALGFDVAFMEQPTNGRRILSTEIRLPAEGDISHQIRVHDEAYRRRDADAWMKNIQVVQREGGGFDLRAMQPRSTDGSKSRLKRFLGRN